MSRGLHRCLSNCRSPHHTEAAASLAFRQLWRLVWVSSDCFRTVFAPLFAWMQSDAIIRGLRRDAPVRKCAAAWGRCGAAARRTGPGMCPAARGLVPGRTRIGNRGCARPHADRRPPSSIAAASAVVQWPVRKGQRPRVAGIFPPRLAVERSRAAGDIRGTTFCAAGETVRVGGLLAPGHWRAARLRRATSFGAMRRGIDAPGSCGAQGQDILRERRWTGE